MAGASLLNARRLLERPGEKAPRARPALRERLLTAVESAKSSKARADLMPEREAAPELEGGQDELVGSDGPGAGRDGGLPQRLRRSHLSCGVELSPQREGVCVKGCPAFCSRLHGLSVF